MSKTGKLAGFFFGVLFMATGCTPVILPPGVVRAAPPTNVEDPDKYRVHSANYPMFRVKGRFEPPRWRSGSFESKFPMVPIETTDVWKVTYGVGEAFLIHSDAYNDRQCKLLASLMRDGMAGGFIRPSGSKCYSDYLYHISITSDGNVKDYGWKLLKNPEVTVVARDRYVDMHIGPATAERWGLQPLFEPIR